MRSTETEKLLLEKAQLRTMVDALAGQNIQLRRALEQVKEEGDSKADCDDGPDGIANRPNLGMRVMMLADAALALPLPDAAREVEAMREKAQMLDWLQEQMVDVIYLDEGCVIDIGGEHQGHLLAALRAAKAGAK